MKKVIIIHRWDGSPQEKIYSWLKEQLEAKGFEVIAPEMPDPKVPVIEAWVNKIKEISSTLDEETCFVGHSIGCQAILRFLETLDEEMKIGKVILLAPWMKLDEQTIKEEGEEVVEIAKPWMETPIDFEKVKTHANNFTAIFSDNDPYVPLSEEKFFKEKLGADTIIQKNKGHFTEGDGVVSVEAVLDRVIK